MIFVTQIIETISTNIIITASFLFCKTFINRYKQTRVKHMVDRIISRKEFRELTGISRSSEWRMKQEGTLPKVVAIKGYILGYRQSDYMKWLKKNTS